MTALRRFWPYLTLILAPLFVLWPAVLLGKAIGPYDQIRQMAPWNGPKPGQPWDVLQADGVLQFAVWRDLVFDSWRHFQVPFWNPYELAGTPLLANSQSAALYPPHIIIGILQIPTAFGMTLLAWYHLAWAGLGTYFFARKVGASRVGGVVAGLSFSLSAFMVAWTGLPSVITTVAWIPWILGLTISLFRGNHVTSFGGRDEPRSRPRHIRRVLLLAVCFGMLILAGHLQFVAYGLMAALIFAGWLTVASLIEKLPERPHPALRGLGGFAVAGLLGVCIALPQLLPVLEYSKFSHRQNQPTEVGYQAYQASAIRTFELVGLMHPNLLGDPTQDISGLQGAETWPAFWPAYVKRGANFAEEALGVGPVVIGLLLLARRRHDWRAIGGVALLGTFGFLLAVGTPLGRILYFLVPGWSASGSPGRISVLFVMATCVLAGVSATQDSEEEPKEKWRLYLPLAAMALVAIGSIYAVMFGTGSFQSWLPQVSPDALQIIIASGTSGTRAMAAISTLVAIVSVGYWLHQKRKPGWALVIGVVASLLLSVPPVLRFSDSANLAVDGPRDARIAVINGPWGLFEAQPALLPPNIAGLNRIHELGGYDSLIHRDTVKMLAGVDGEDPSPEANGNMMFVKKHADPRKLADAGVSEVWQLGPDGLKKTPLEGPGRASTPAGPATIVSETASRLVLKAIGPGILSIRDRNMPGWTATVDGAPTPIQGDLWREIQLPAAEHEVVCNYVAPGYAIGLLPSLLAWLIVAVGILAVSLRKNPRKVT